MIKLEPIDMIIEKRSIVEVFDRVLEQLVVMSFSKLTKFYIYFIRPIRFIKYSLQLINFTIEI